MYAYSWLTLPHTISYFKNRKECIVRLYEQGADNDSIGEYIKQWWRWLLAGIGDLCSGWKEEIKKDVAPHYSKAARLSFKIRVFPSFVFDKFGFILFFYMQ